tara:strand:+ start:18366 stop:18620 length:255 start_codon:yes stop_codon:yes gene_type:complete
MGSKKTIDGIRISKIVRMLLDLEGVQIRKGTNHPFVAKRKGLRSCPIASSTHAKKMLVPWIVDATGYESNLVYSSLRAGSWTYT